MLYPEVPYRTISGNAAHTLSMFFFAIRFPIDNVEHPPILSNIELQKIKKRERRRRRKEKFKKKDTGGGAGGSSGSGQSQGGAHGHSHSSQSGSGSGTSHGNESSNKKSHRHHGGNGNGDATSNGTDDAAGGAKEANADGGSDEKDPDDSLREQIEYAEVRGDNCADEVMLYVMNMYSQCMLHKVFSPKSWD